MNGFTKGDILIGKERKFNEAYHPIVFIAGPSSAPLAVVLTHSVPEKFPCNFKLSGEYDKRTSHFVAHLVEKMAEWGPYEKIGELTKEDMSLVETHTAGLAPITWEQYERRTKSGCPEHGPITQA